MLHPQSGTGAPLRPLLSELGAHLPNPHTVDCSLLRRPGEDHQGAGLPGRAAAGGPTRCRCDRAELHLPTAPGTLGYAGRSWRREAHIPHEPNTMERSLELMVDPN